MHFFKNWSLAEALCHACPFRPHKTNLRHRIAVFACSTTLISTEILSWKYRQSSFLTWCTKLMKVRGTVAVGKRSHDTQEIFEQFFFCTLVGFLRTTLLFLLLSYFILLSTTAEQLSCDWNIFPSLCSSKRSTIQGYLRYLWEERAECGRMGGKSWFKWGFFL